MTRTTTLTDADVRAIRDRLLDRQALRARILDRGASKVRITRNGEVHAYGPMPNTSKVGWYLVGFDTNLIAEMKWEDGQ